MRDRIEPQPIELYSVWARTSAFARRVERARECLRAAAQFGNLVVSVSWGKDSSAMAHLALETLGPVPLVHMASSYRLPGWESVRDYFSARMPVHEMEPTRTLEDTIAWLHEVGLGCFRSSLSATKVTNRKKRDRVAEWCVAQGFTAQALGMRAEESAVRRALFRSRGDLYTRADGMVIAIPLAWWTARDVWAYLISRSVAYHPLYDHETHGMTRETLRNTGWLTTIDAQDGRVAWLRAHYPEQCDQLTREWPALTAMQ